MDLTKPYEKKYLPNQVLKGLTFYFALLDKVNIEIYLKENFPLKRKDIELLIHFLSTLSEKSEINRISFSHPQLTLAMESLEQYASLAKEKLMSSENQIYFCLDHLVNTATNLMVFNAKFEIPKVIDDLTIEEKIKYLIENKYYYTQNEGSFPTNFVIQAVAYCDSLIEKYKELRSAEDVNPINEEVKKMVESYFSLIKNSVEKNNLVQPLVNNRYDEFIVKLKSMMLIPSYFDIKSEDKERIFHVYLLGVLQGKIEGYRVSSNKESGIGRYDIALIPVEAKNPAVIIEIKKLPVSSKVDLELDKALKQIQIKQYKTEINTLGINTILNISIVFEGLEPHLKYSIQS